MSGITSYNPYSYHYYNLDYGINPAAIRKTTETVPVDPRSLSTLVKDFEYARKGNFLPAHKRLALFICDKLNEDVFNAKFRASEQPPSLGYLPILSDVTPESNTYDALYWEELELLYNRLTDVFEGKIENRITANELKIRWDAGAPTGELANILRSWINSLTSARESKDMPLPALPPWSGLYLCEDGCASFNGQVIDHEGRLLWEDPWKRFLRTENRADEKRAKELEPTIPLELKNQYKSW